MSLPTRDHADRFELSKGKGGCGCLKAKAWRSNDPEKDCARMIGSEDQNQPSPGIFPR